MQTMRMIVNRRYTVANTMVFTTLLVNAYKCKNIRFNRTASSKPLMYVITPNQFGLDVKCYPYMYVSTDPSYRLRTIMEAFDPFKEKVSSTP